MSYLLERLRKARNAGEEGMALAGVVMLSSFVFIAVVSIAMTSIVSSNLTANNRSALLTLSSADAGIDAAVLAASTGSSTLGSCTQSKTSSQFGYTYSIYRSASTTPPTNTTDSGVSAGCPQNGDKYMLVKSSGTDYRGKATTIVSTYQWTIKGRGQVNGAIVSGGGNVSLSQLIISGANGDLILLSGAFNCNNSTTVSGNLIVLNGTSLSISNACNIVGSVYSTGSVTIANAGVSVGGDVYSLGDVTASNPATINGSIYARGSIKMAAGTKVLGSIISQGASNSFSGITIGGNLTTTGPISIGTAGSSGGSVVSGNVTSASTASSNFYGSTVNGSINLAGYLAQFGASKTGVDLIAAAPGQVNTVAPTSTIGGSIRLGGTISSSGGTPSVGGTVSQNQTLPAPAAPIFATPAQLLPGAYPWIDYNYNPNDWIGAGYAITTPASVANCNYQGNLGLISAVNSLTTPTVIDMRGCATAPNFYGVTFTLQTDVAFIANQFSAQNLTVNSSSSSVPHEFDMITPDLVADGSPTCSVGQGAMGIYGIKMGANITNFIYSPCTVVFGGTSNLNGQIYSGIASYSGGGSTNLVYKPTGLPGLPGPSTNVNNFNSLATIRSVPTLVSRSEQ